MTSSVLKKDEIKTTTTQNTLYCYYCYHHYHSIEQYKTVHILGADTFLN